jgi:hypothetical protein
MMTAAAVVGSIAAKQERILACAKDTLASTAFAVQVAPLFCKCEYHLQNTPLS